MIIDRRSTSVGSDESYSDHEITLLFAYNSFFAIILILGNAVLVFEEYYNTDGQLTFTFAYNTKVFVLFHQLLGYFRFSKRIISSLKRMSKDLAISALAGIVLVYDFSVVKLFEGAKGSK